MHTLDRREFAVLLAGFLAGKPARELLGRVGVHQGDLRVDGRRLNATLEALGRIGRNPATGGINRLAFSEADLQARNYVAGLMREAGLDVEVDYAGNLVGTRGGREAAALPIVFGSHIDSVPEGGNYDGPVGALAAVEVARVLGERGIQLRHPIEVMVFSNEEGGKTGSRALIGEVDPKELSLPTASGRTIGEGIALVGGDPEKLEQVKREPGSIKAFLELHVEQGSVLEQSRVQIGVVEGIVGIKRWNVTVEGFANHAGTTPMDARRDALVAAARFVDLAHRVAKETPGRQVATVGRISAEPGAPNVIPGRVLFSLEIRDLEMSKIDRIFEQLRAEADAIGRDTGTAFAFELFYVSYAALTDERLRQAIEQAASALELSHMRLPSGAGHDAQSMAKLGPAGMIFVPSKSGISHSPLEFTAPEDVVNGANVLLRTIVAVDAM
ncbi:N-carbamoyl-L-amino acid hydrolase [bacterium HR33]|nr:N-carbamoyl-L-amino acid hydrolase [bacterium HR33]